MPKISCRILCLLAMFALSGCCSRECAPTAAHTVAAGTPAASSAVPTPSPDMVVAGDVVDVMIDGEEELTGAFRVGPDGNIVLPLVGPVTVAGHRAVELPAIIDRAYRGDYLVDPKVAVDVEERGD